MSRDKVYDWETFKQLATPNDVPVVHDISIDADRIGVGFIACQHIGSRGVDYQLAEDHAKMIRDTPNAFVFFGGDVIDNFILPKMMMAAYNSISGPDEQYRVYEDYLSFFGPGKILGATAGNHEFWTPKMSGIDYLGFVNRSKGLLYDPCGIAVRIRLPGQDYVIRIRHKFRFNSAFNLTHTVKRMYDMGRVPFDIGVVCHHHEGTVEPFTKHGKRVLAIRTGSYKCSDPHAEQFGFETGNSEMPFVILYAGKRRMVPFMDIRDGVEFFK